MGMVGVTNVTAEERVVGIIRQAIQRLPTDFSTRWLVVFLKRQAAAILEPALDPKKDLHEPYVMENEDGDLELVDPDLIATVCAEKGVTRGKLHQILNIPLPSDFWERK